MEFFNVPHIRFSLDQNFMTANNIIQAAPGFFMCP